MKPTTILSTGALLASAHASTAHSNVHAVADLIARALDPATMDPTKLSVLSVLKTAMPTATGTDIVLPTGDATPQWYKDLPADVMVLLAQMYPATSDAAVSETPSAAVNTSSSLPQETASTLASQTTITRSLELLPTAVAAGNGTLSTDTPNDNSTNGTLTTGSPSPTQSASSSGAKKTAGTGKWSIVTGLLVAACFFAFA